MNTFLNLVVSFVFILMTVSGSQDLSNDWGDTIRWTTLEQAQKESKITGNPIMLIIHKSWCGACKALRPKFKESAKIAELSKYFVMVNTLDDDEPKDSMYAPDGGYVPRIMFISDGKVRDDFIHKNGNPKYKYYYHSEPGLLATMERAVEKLDLLPLGQKREEL